MSDEKPKAEGAEAPAKKGLPIKFIGIVAGLMIAEGAAVFMLVGASRNKPAAAEAVTLATGDAGHADAMVELPLLEEQFQNMLTGRVWVWDTAIVLRVKKRHEERVLRVLNERQFEVHEGISTIFRRATFAQLKDPGMETVNRQVLAFLDGVLGMEEADGERRSYIDRVLIPKSRGFPAD